MLTALMAYSNGAYLFQQGVVFLMWMVLLKVGIGELRAICGEETPPVRASRSPSEREPGRPLRENAGGFRRGAPVNAWRIENEMSPRMRRRSGKQWNRVGAS